MYASFSPIPISTTPYAVGVKNVKPVIGKKTLWEHANQAIQAIEPVKFFKFECLCSLKQLLGILHYCKIPQ